MLNSAKVDAIKEMSTDVLIPYGSNARTHSVDQVSQIAASMREFGFNNPILIDEGNGIIAGHGRLEAARLLGMETVPTITLAHLSEAQKKAYILADNKLALNAGWDMDMLQAELEGLQDLDFDLSLTGFDDGELADLLDKTDGLTDPDAIPENVTPTAQTGDVWRLGRHTLVCGDSTDASVVSACLGGITPHLMVTDPPYGVEYDASWRATAGVNKNAQKMGKVQNDERADWSEAWALFPGDVAYVWHDGKQSATVQGSLEGPGVEIRAQIIWAKDRFALSRGHYHWQHEPCWYAVRGDTQWSGSRSQSTVWQIKARDDKGHGHSTQKPVECMKRPIENNSSAGQAVYEPFSGSGTTIIAAEMSGRACHAIELNPEYVDIAVKRWEAFTGREAIHEQRIQTDDRAAQAR